MRLSNGKIRKRIVLYNFVYLDPCGKSSFHRPKNNNMTVAIIPQRQKRKITNNDETYSLC